MGKKRSLLIQYAAESQKKNKTLADAIQEQIADIEAKMKDNSVMLASVESTPKKNNKTPESAIEGE